jgi:hypothetical protein
MRIKKNFFFYRTRINLPVWFRATDLSIVMCAVSSWGLGEWGLCKRMRSPLRAEVGRRRGNSWMSEVSAFPFVALASGDAIMRLRARLALYRGYPLLSGFLSGKGDALL